MGDVPLIKLYRNPWSKTLPDGVLHQILLTAASNAAVKLQMMLDSGEVEDDRDSFAAVLLDPTRPRSALTFADRLLASIEIGPNAAKYLLNGAAKADAHDRHDMHNGDLVEHYSHCLGDGDFAYGDSAEYEYAIGGGSGLSPEQDGEMVAVILKEVIDQVRSRRNSWLEESRREGHHRWYNPDDVPGDDYAGILELYATTPAIS